NIPCHPRSTLFPYTTLFRSEFKEGVNAIVGEQNTGKSTWLRMLDFLMGENESAKENFDEVIIQKYRAISSLLRFGTETVEIERRSEEHTSELQSRGHLVCRL